MIKYKIGKMAVTAYFERTNKRIFDVAPADEIVPYTKEDNYCTWFDLLYDEIESSEHGRCDRYFLVKTIDKYLKQVDKSCYTNDYYGVAINKDGRDKFDEEKGKEVARCKLLKKFYKLKIKIERDMADHFYHLAAMHKDRELAFIARREKFIDILKGNKVSQ